MQPAFSFSSFPAYWTLSYWWIAYSRRSTVPWKLMESLRSPFLGDIMQDTAEGRRRNDTGYTFIQKWFGKENCLFFSLLSSHFSTLLQLTLFCWQQRYQHEEGKRHFLKWYMSCWHPYFWEGVRSLLFKLVNIISGTASCWSSFYSVGDRSLRCLSGWHSNVFSVMGEVSTVLPLVAGHFVKPSLLNRSYHFKHLSNWNKIINHIQSLCYRKLFSSLADTMAQTCTSLDEKATRWQNNPLWTKNVCLRGQILEMGDRKSLWSSFMCISFSWRNAQCPKTTHWEDTFLLHRLSCWCAYREPIVTAAWDKCLPDHHISTQQQK